MGYIGGMEMITNLVVNGVELTVEYDLDVSAVYFGDLESEYVEIDILKVLWNAPVLENGIEVIRQVNALPIIEVLENVETLKLIIRDRFEDIQ
jgi:hypothetical protein